MLSLFLIDVCEDTVSCYKYSAVIFNKWMFIKYVICLTSCILNSVVFGIWVLCKGRKQKIEMPQQFKITFWPPCFASDYYWWQFHSVIQWHFVLVKCSSWPVLSYRRSVKWWREQNHLLILLHLFKQTAIKEKLRCIFEWELFAFLKKMLERLDWSIN